MCQYLGLKTKFPLCINEITNLNCFVVKSSNSCSTDPSVTINDLYEIPTKKETKPSIHKVMNYIKEQEIKVSSLNIKYKGSTYIKNKVLRKQLKKQFGDGVFQAYTKNEDKKLKQRWEELRNAKVDFHNFKKNLFDFCEGGRQRNKKKFGDNHLCGTSLVYMLGKTCNTILHTPILTGSRKFSIKVQV